MRHLVAVAAVSLVCSACYLNSLDGEFAYDDGAAIRKNPVVSGNASAADAFIKDFWGESLLNETSHKSYRPLTTLSFRYLWRAKGGQPLPFHIACLACHVTTSALVGVLCWHVLAGAYLPSTCKLASLVCCALFATHPVHTEAVSNVVSLCELLCSFFFILGFLAYRAAQRRQAPRSIPYFAASCVLLSCSVLSKETGLTSLGMLAAYDILFFLSLDPPPIQRTKPQATFSAPGALGRQIAIWILAGVYIWWKRRLTGDHFLPIISVLDNSAANAPDSLSIALSFMQTHAVYARLLVFPAKLSCDYSRNTLPNITSLHDARNAHAAAAYGSLLVLLLGGFVQARRSGRTPLLQGVFWMTIPFALSSNILFPVGTVVGERLLYLPSAGFCIICAHMWAELVETKRIPVSTAEGTKSEGQGGTTEGKNRKVQDRNKGRNEMAECSAKTRDDSDPSSGPVTSWRLVLGAILAVGVCAAYSVRTYVRNPVWKSTSDLFAAHIKMVPRSVRMSHGLASDLANTGEHALAVKHYKRAIKLLQDEDFASGVRQTDFHVDLIALYEWELANAYTESGGGEKALKHYKAAVALRPAEYRYQNRLAFNLVQARRYEEGYKAFYECYKLRPLAADMVNNLGNVFMATNQVSLAVRSYKLSQRLQPGSSDNMYNLGLLQLRTPGMQRDGISSLMHARRLDPKDKDINAALDRALRILGGRK